MTRQPWRGAHCALPLSLLVLGVTTRSGAAERIDIPGECGSAQVFWDGVSRLVGADVPRPSMTEVTITGPRSDGTYTLHLSVDGEVRRLEHTDCGMLLRSAEVITASILRPQGVSAPPANPRGRASSLPGDPSATPGAQPPPGTTSPRRRRFASTTSDPVLGQGSHGDVRVGGGLGAVYGVVPEVGTQASLHAAAMKDHWGGVLSIRYVPPTSTSEDGRAVEVQAVGGQIAGRFSPIPWYALSVGLQLDWMVGRGAARTPARRVDSAWSVAPCAEVAVIPWRFEHLETGVGLAGCAAVVRPRFVVDGFGPLYEVGPLGVAGQVHASWRLP